MSPYVLIIACILVGWFHGTFFIPVKPEGVSASKWAPLESQAIQEGANYAFIIVALAVWIHRRRLIALRWLVLESLTSIVIAGELALVLAFLFGCLSSMGMPGLFWQHQPVIQFITGIGVTLYAFWMFYLLFATYQQQNIADSKRKLWARYDDRWPSHSPPMENQDTLTRFFFRFGSLLVFVLVLPASFPALRAWDQHRYVEWPWLMGVANGILAVAFLTRHQPITGIQNALVRACRSLLSPLRQWFARSDLKANRLTDQEANMDEASPKSTLGNPVLLVVLLYGFLYSLSYLDRVANLELLKHVMPAGVSLCVLLATVASFLVWLHGKSAKAKAAVIVALMGLVTFTGSRDYKVLCRDLELLGFYPTSQEQYAMTLRNFMGGRKATRQARADGKRAEEEPATYRQVIDLAAIQEKQFEPFEFNRASEVARATREDWLKNWKSNLSRTPSDKPVLVVVCTSGGALRAALWTEVVLDHMAKNLPGFEDRVRLITGASGGMLGAARFVVSIHEQSRMPALAKNDPPDYLEAIARQIALSDLIPSMFLPWSTPNRGDVLEDEFGKYESRKSRQMDEAIQEGTKRSLSGINTTFAQLFEQEKEGRVPSIIFSPMIAEDGRRLLISNQPLADLVAHAKGFPLVSEDEGELVRRIQGGEGKRPMSQLELELPLVASSPAIEFFNMFGSDADKVRRNFRLCSAVRMSATFPYVTPSVVLPTDPPRHIVDAGYYDNFGVNLAARWIAGNAEWIRSNTAGVLVVQIRAFRNERALKLYDPEYQPPSTIEEDDDKSSGSIFPSLHFVQGLMTGFRDWLVPLQGAAQAENRSMYFRNDEQLLALHDYFREYMTGTDDGFFKTVIFTCDSHTPGDLRGTSATLNWYMTSEEFRSIKENMLPLARSANGRDRNDLRMEQLKSWWAGRGQGN